jgi:hypothetical protein
MKQYLHCTTSLFYKQAKDSLRLFAQKGFVKAAAISGLLAALFLAGCKDPYEVKVKDSQKSVLVVEGFLNSGGETNIKLSRSYGLSDSARLTVESGASVTVETKNAGQFPLAESFPGTYGADLGVLDATQQYRLRIRTGGREYLSDYVNVQSTPPIDSIGWSRDSKGVTVHATTHDPANGSHYYRYVYEETWEEHASFIASFFYDANSMVFIAYPNADVYQCWKTVNSSNINLATSTALQNDVIFEKPLVRIVNDDPRLLVRYSILVRQYVLSKEAYEFFQLMKKNTETLGTVFDPQPTELTGNVHSINDRSEQVIGIFYGSSEQQKRIFIDASDVPGWTVPNDCFFLKVDPNIDTLKKFAANGLYAFDKDPPGFGPAIDYKVAERRCFDCRLNGGVTTKPVFW